MARLVYASDRGLYVVFDEATTAASGRNVAALEAWLRESPPPGLVDLHPGYATLLVRFDPLKCDPESLARDLAARACSLVVRPHRAPRAFEIPVRYGGEFGPDLPEVARSLGLSEDDVVRAHAGGDYEVRFLGFCPGFPYLAGLPARLHTARRGTPRPRVEAGSVAIAGPQAGIYPVRSPGGWNVIGRTEFVLFDPRCDPAATLAPGDLVRFRPMTGGS